MTSAPQYVTLVVQGGTPVRLGNQLGAPYPTTGRDALVFSDGPTIHNPIFTGRVLNVTGDSVGLGIGSAEDPSVYFGPEENNDGFYSEGTHQVNVTINGIQQARFTQDGLDVFGDIDSTRRVTAMNGQFTQELTAPTPPYPSDNSRVATTAYVTDAVQTAITGAFLPLAGGTVSGDLWVGSVIHLDPADATVTSQWINLHALNFPGLEFVSTAAPANSKNWTLIQDAGNWDFVVVAINDDESNGATWRYKRDGSTTFPGDLTGTNADFDWYTAKSADPGVSWHKEGGAVDKKLWHQWVSSGDANSDLVIDASSDTDTLLARWSFKRDGSMTLPGVATGVSPPDDALGLELVTAAWVRANGGGGGGGGGGGDFLPLTGGTLSGLLTLAGTTNDTARIDFSRNDNPVNNRLWMQYVGPGATGPMYLLATDDTGTITHSYWTFNRNGSTTFPGPVTLPAGTLAATSLNFGTANSGLIRSPNAAAEIFMVVGGQSAMEFHTGQNVTIRQTLWGRKAEFSEYLQVNRINTDGGSGMELNANSQHDFLIQDVYYYTMNQTSFRSNNAAATLGRSQNPWANYFGVNMTLTGTLTVPSLAFTGPFTGTAGTFTQSVDGPVTLLSLNNSSTGASSAADFIQNAGGRSVLRQVIYSSTRLHETSSTGITNRYSDFDTHIFRDNAGTQRVVINSSGVGIFSAFAATSGAFSSTLVALSIAVNTNAAPLPGAAGQAFIKASSTPNLGLYYGTGAPAFAAAKGSVYSNTTATGSFDRMFVNTDGATSWANFTTNF